MASFTLLYLLTGGSTYSHQASHSKVIVTGLESSVQASVTNYASGSAPLYSMIP